MIRNLFQIPQMNVTRVPGQRLSSTVRQACQASKVKVSLVPGYYLSGFHIDGGIHIEAHLVWIRAVLFSNLFGEGWHKISFSS
jgi:hypothetical protein